MSVAHDIATYLTMEGVAGRISESYVPAIEAGRSISITPYGGQESFETHDGPDSRLDIARFQVRVEELNDPDGAEQSAQDIQNRLVRIVNLTINGNRYLRVRALQPPFVLGRDKHEKTVNVANYEAYKTPDLPPALVGS